MIVESSTAITMFLLAPSLCRLVSLDAVLGVVFEAAASRITVSDRDVHQFNKDGSLVWALAGDASTI